MARFKIIFDGEEQDEVFATEEEAEEYALYLCSCARTGAETLHCMNTMRMSLRILSMR